MNWRSLNIKVYGNKKGVESIKSLLDEIELTGLESKDRLILQRVIDDNKIKEHIIYDGNSIISYYRIISEYKRILKKREFVNMSDYFYEFLHLNCGSIAHYNKSGWLYEYNSLEKLKSFFFYNEFGTNIVNNQPSWKSDVIRIAEAILELSEDKKSIENTCNQLNMFSCIA